MIVLFVLLGLWAVLRGIGSLGVAMFGNWHDAARYALAGMFVFTAVSHFTPMKHDQARMVPRIFPRPLAVIYFTVVLEFLGAVGLVIPRFETLAEFCLIALLIAMFPANVKAAREHLTLGGRPATRLWLRLPMQVLFIGLLWWSTRRQPA
jgi:uncharacterized membrane protein